MTVVEIQVNQSKHGLVSIVYIILMIHMRRRGLPDVTGYTLVILLPRTASVLCAVREVSTDFYGYTRFSVVLVSR